MMSKKQFSVWVMFIVCIFFNNSVFSSDSLYKIPHIPSNLSEWDSFLILDNMSGDSVQLTLTLYDEQGSTVIEESISSPGFSYKEINLSELKYSGSASGTVTDPGSHVSVRIVYKNKTQGGTAEFRLNEDASPLLAYNFGVYEESLTWKGMALFNNENLDSTVNFYAFDKNMDQIGTFQTSIPGRGHLAFTLDDSSAFGIGFPWDECARVYAVSPGSISGLNISGVNIEKLLFTPAAEAIEMPENTQIEPTGEYKIIAWNDLGMHCYDDDYSMFSILPPYNTLWAQVIKTGATPEIVTEGITVSYQFENNSTSIGKTNFWDYEDSLFGVNLAPDTGLTGKTLNDTMDSDGDHFIAEGIPLTHLNDDMTENYYQTAIVTARNNSGQIIAQTRTVAPVSDEMHCSSCHNDYGVEGIATGHFRTNILALHDQEEGTHLSASQPVLCASCHTSNALGTQGSQDDLSHVIHSVHAEHVSGGTEGCYNCHPGADTKCLRGVMFQDGMGCTNCHGSMEQVGSDSREPWLDEPNCGDCHDYGTPEGTLYRMSTGHGGVYCEACHGSPHAILPSANPADNIQSIMLQGESGPLYKCAVCHTDGRSGDNPHESYSHPDGWRHDHGDYVEDNGSSSCIQCHGSDYRGGTSGVSCYQCHNGPDGGDDDD